MCPPEALAGLKRMPTEADKPGGTNTAKALPVTLALELPSTDTGQDLWDKLWINRAVGA